MSLNAAAVLLMAQKGLTAFDIAEIMAAAEVKKDPTNAARQARYRVKKSNAVTVTPVTPDDPPPNEYISNPPPSPPSPKGDTPKAQKGGRLPDDFEMPVEWKNWARGERGWAPDVIETEAANFTDYWQARATGATKRDWRKAWQNWVRNSKRPDGTHRNAKPVTRESTEEHAARLERIGQTEAADDLRRRFSTGPPRPVGQLVAGIARQAGRGG